MRGAIPPLPNTPSWRGAQLKKMKNSTGTTLPFTLQESQHTSYHLLGEEEKEIREHSESSDWWWGFTEIRLTLVLLTDDTTSVNWNLLRSHSFQSTVAAVPQDTSVPTLKCCITVTTAKAT
jgi:hypothetical protein